MALGSEGQIQVKKGGEHMVITLEKVLKAYFYVTVGIVTLGFIGFWFDGTLGWEGVWVITALWAGVYLLHISRISKKKTK